MFFPIRIDGVPPLPAPAIAVLISLLTSIHAINLLDPTLHLHSLLSATSSRLSYKALTDSLVHRNGLHLITNLVYLYFFGNLICRALGTGALLVVTVAAAGVSGLMDVALHENAVGASGIASGLMGAALAAYPLRKFRFLYLLGFSNGLFSITLIWVVVLAIIVDMSGLIYYAVNSVLFENVAYWDHIGGFVIGYVIAYAGIRDGILRRRQNREPSIHSLLDSPRSLLPQVVKTTVNGRLVDTWALFIFIIAIVGAIGVYRTKNSFPTYDARTNWVFLSQLLIFSAASLTVFWTTKRGVYLATIIVIATVLVNLILRSHIHADMFLILLWLLQAKTEKVYWPRILKTRYPTISRELNEHGPTTTSRLTPEGRLDASQKTST